MKKYATGTRQALQHYFQHSALVALPLTLHSCNQALPADTHHPHQVHVLGWYLCRLMSMMKYFFLIHFTFLGMILTLHLLK